MRDGLRRTLSTLFDFRAHLSRFTADPRILDRRLKARLSVSEAVGVFSALGFLTMVLYMHAANTYEANDFKTYVDASHGDYWGYYYADWFLPVFRLLDLLPGLTGFALWNTLNVLAVFFAARVFSGNVLVIMTGYQLLYVLYYGNIIGLIVGALALLWWALAHQRWHLAGLALLIAATKYQIGLPVGATLLLTADVTWSDRARVLLVPVLAGLLSLVVYPLWPLDTFDRLQSSPPADWGSITLWRWTGILALLLWLPVMLLPLTRPARLVAVVAALALATPYFQQTDLLLLFALPVGALGVLGNAGYLYFWYQWEGLRLLVLIPLIAYIVVIGPPLVEWWRSQRAPRSEAQSAS